MSAFFYSAAYCCRQIYLIFSERFRVLIRLINESGSSFRKGALMDKDKGELYYRRYLEGDDTALVDMICDYKDGVILYLCGITGSFSLAEEYMEDTFFRIAAKKPRFSGRSSFKTWLFTIARNTAIDGMRKMSRISDKPIRNTAIFPMSAASKRNTFVRNRRSRFTGLWSPLTPITDRCSTSYFLRI